MQSYIHEHWASDHILATNKTLLDWQHLDQKNNRYNFVIAKNEDRIEGILGFIPTSHFDSTLSEDTVWLTTWKVTSQHAGLGLQLRHYLTQHFPSKRMGTVGLNQATLALYKVFGYTTGVLPHYVMLNPHIHSFNILSNPHPLADNKKRLSTPYTWKKVDSQDRDIFIEDTGTPKKSWAYIQNRYIKHPFYKYEVFTLSDAHQVKGVIVCRRVAHDSRYACRIIDFIGDISIWPHLNFDTLFDDTTEYIDLLNYGISETVLADIGFQPSSDSLLVPHYFEPFSPKPVPVLFAFKPDTGLIFKGDCDQDRPNKL